MKLKARLRHFWRNNKKILAMYMTFISAIPLLINVLLFDMMGALYWFIILGLWLLHWRDERTIDAMYRAYNVDMHTHDKELSTAKIKAFEAGCKSAMTLYSKGQ